MLLDRLVLGPVDLGVEQQLVVVGVDPHDVGGDLTARQQHADRAEVAAGAGELTDGRFEHVPEGSCAVSTW